MYHHLSLGLILYKLKTHHKVPQHSEKHECCYPYILHVLHITIKLIPFLHPKRLYVA